jgi:hypothetical protein
MERRAAAREFSGMEADFCFRSRGGLRSRGVMVSCLGEFGVGGDGTLAARRFSPLER